MATEPKAPDSLQGTMVSAGSGVVMLLVSALLTYGAFFEPRAAGDTFRVPPHAYLLLVTVWSLTVQLLLGPVRRQALRRVASAGGTMAIASFVGFFTWMLLLAVIEPPPASPRGFGHYTFVVLVLGATASGLFLALVSLLQHRAARKAGRPAPPLTPGTVLAWPLLAFAKAPLGTAVAFGLVAAGTGLGEWLGGRAGHPLAGAAAGLVLPLLAAALAAGRFAASQLRGGR